MRECCHAEKGENRCAWCPASHHPSWNRAAGDSGTTSTRKNPRAPWEAASGIEDLMLCMGDPPKPRPSPSSHRNRSGCLFDGPPSHRLCHSRSTSATDVTVTCFRTATSLSSARKNPTFFELVRYIHLNPVRAGIAAGMDELDVYVYSGHSALMGSLPRPWQDTEYVLALFSHRQKTARSLYRSFIEKGISQGHRKNSSAAGWCEAIRVEDLSLRRLSAFRPRGSGTFNCSIQN